MDEVYFREPAVDDDEGDTRHAPIIDQSHLIGVRRDARPLLWESLVTEECDQDCLGGRLDNIHIKICCST